MVGQRRCLAECPGCSFPFIEIEWIGIYTIVVKKVSILFVRYNTNNLLKNFDAHKCVGKKLLLK